MLRIEEAVGDCKSFLAELNREMRSWVERRLEGELTQEVDRWLGRKPHGRRAKLGWRQVSGACPRCGSRRVKDFSRNGYRGRQMVTRLGVVRFGLPRVRCACGGSVAVPLATVRPYQQVWEDVLEQVGQWALWGVSLRQMQGLLGEQAHTSVGISTLNRIVQKPAKPVELALTSVPPVVLLDAIWVTLLEAEDRLQIDAKGRQRKRKRKLKVCVLVALGVYPQSGRWGILGWSLAEGETQAAWEELLIALDSRGLYRQRGLELLIHDGGGGLQAALQQVYPHLPQQRCLFHKLRNLRQAIVAPSALSPSERRTFKSDLMRLMRPIFQATDLHQARHLTDTFCAAYGESQPKLVTTLLLDWHANFAFFRVLARFPNWPRRFLRTTSLLERVNRSIRRLFRAAGAFHSRVGLLATVTRVLAPYRLT